VRCLPCGIAVAQGTTVAPPTTTTKAEESEAAGEKTPNLYPPGGCLLHYQLTECLAALSSPRLRQHDRQHDLQPSRSCAPVVAGPAPTFPAFPPLPLHPGCGTQPVFVHLNCAPPPGH